MVWMKHKKIYGCCFNYALSELIVNHGLQDLWRRENLDSFEVIRYGITSGLRSSIDNVYNDIKNANNIKINHIMISLTDHYNAISIERLPSKNKIGNNSWYFNNSILCHPDFSSTTKNLLSLLKTQKSSHSSASDWWNTINLIFKRMLQHFLKIQPLTEY